MMQTDVLNVNITPDKTQYGPRDLATYDIAVTDSDGKPVQAIRSLEHAVANGYAVAVIKDDDDLVTLRGMPAFQALVNRK